MNMIIPRHFVVLVIISLLILLSWYYMVFSMTMNMEPVEQWSLSDLFMLFIMWAVMMAGMMLPSATPMILLVDKLNKKRQINNRAFVHTFYFVLGYLLAWTFYSILITFVQWQLHKLSLLSPMMISKNASFSGVLLLIAGIYQWTPLKQRCLQWCRSPLSILTTQWQEGISGAIRLGIVHGQYCLGCCWFLMALLFVTGVMSLQWILVLTIIVMVEKLFPKGEWLGKALGVLLIIYGGGLLLNNVIANSSSMS